MAQTSGRIWVVEMRGRKDWQFCTAEPSRKDARELRDIMRQMSPAWKFRVVPYYRGALEALTRVAMGVATRKGRP